MKEWYEKIDSSQTLDELEKLRIDIFGKKGILASEFAKMKTLSNEEKGDFAKSLNSAKSDLQALYDSKKLLLEQAAIALMLKEGAIDVSLYASQSEAGALHPVMQTMDKIVDYFTSMNFSVHTGPLIEDDFHNFEALNLPKFHPARDMQDTFYFADESLLRTHTSPVQIRTMLTETPPIRMIAPGAVFRRDYDLTHTPMFHQVEGLVVEKVGAVSFANLKFILEDFFTLYVWRY